MKIILLFIAVFFFTDGYSQIDVNYSKKNITLDVKEWKAIKMQNHLVENNLSQNKNTITGDFNGDSKKETLYLVAPTEDTLATDPAKRCFGACDSYIITSNYSLPILKAEYNLGGEMKNIGDLDGDGGDDILILPYWWQSNWNPYCVYSYNAKTKEWKYLIEPVSIYLSELYFTKNLVKKSKRTHHVTAYTSKIDKNGNTKSRYKDFIIIK